ncbi:MAG: lysophospholipid acyltransferase family protein [Saprospiraceae bacterium]
MLYRILKWLFVLTVRGYFRSISIRGLEQIPVNKPILVAANHTSAFMDPILLAVHIHRPLYFLARGSAFRKKWIAWILGKLHMIPVYRPEFEPDEVSRNEETFARCFDHLATGKAILIFPEGVSKTERRLRPLKTGIARIGLGAEARHDFQLDVQIIPIGINYSNPHRFQSDVFVNVGHTIDLSEYRQPFSQDPRTATRLVMDKLQAELERRTVIIEDERLAILTGLIEKLYRSELRDDTKAQDKLHQDFYLSREIATAVQWFDQHHPDQVVAFERRIRAYLHHVERLNLRDTQLRQPFQRMPILRIGFFLLAGFPLFLAGWLANILPFKLAEWVAGRIRVREDFVGSIRLSAGMFIFLFTYLIQAGGVALFTSWATGIACLLLFYPAGLYALYYLKSVFHLRYSLDYLFIRQKRSALILRLRAIRQELIQELEAGKESFLSRAGTRQAGG